jgi:cell wall-associated NlpC family hydrolase
MVTYNELLNARPDKLKDSADAWNKWSLAVSDHADQLAAVHNNVTTNWSGFAADQAKSYVAHAHLRASSTAATLAQVEKALNAAYTKFAQAHNDLISAGNQAVNVGFSVTDDGQVTDPNNLIGTATGDRKTQLSQAKTSIQGSIDTAVKNATAADGEVAATLRSLMPGGGFSPDDSGGGTDLAGGHGTPLTSHVDYPSTGDMQMPPNALSNAPNPQARAVLQYASAQLGDPYVFGTAGPNTFDCSGLSQQAYKAIGVDLPHNAAAQWAQGPRIPDGQEQPGDLVFFTEGKGSVQHVGIVLDPKAGTMIAAPHTGSYVKIESYKTFPGGYLGFTRPGMP